jgi:hypothetical protein
MRRRVVAAAMLPLLLLTIAYASVFVYYPMTITTTVVDPPVVFDYGSNANQADLQGSNTISVSISSQNTSITITLHPTYQNTLYKNVSLIKNLDTKAYNVYIRVLTPLSLPASSVATLQIRSLDGTTIIASVDLLSTGTTSIGSLAAGGIWSMWVSYTIPEQSSPPPTTSATLQLIYTPSSETPP